MEACRKASQARGFFRRPANPLCEAWPVQQRRRSVADLAGHGRRDAAGVWGEGGGSGWEGARVLGPATARGARRYGHLPHSHLRATVKTLDAVVRGVDTSVDTSAPKATPEASENRAKALPT